MRLREQIINADDRPSDLVDVPEWGCKVLLRGLTVAGLERVQKVAGKDGENDARVAAATLIEAVYDPDTKERVFAATDLDVVAEKSVRIISRLGDVIARLSGSSETEGKELGNGSSGTDGSTTPSTSQSD